MRRIDQPPFAPAARASEARDFWPAFVLALVGAVVAFCSAGHMTGIDTLEDRAATETQLVMAFSKGGLKYNDAAAPAPPPATEPLTPASPPGDRRVAEAPDGAFHWKVRVDTGARTPCPT